MKFGNINQIVLFGGSRILAELAMFLKKQDKYSFDIYTCERQLKDIIYPDGTSLETWLKKHSIKYHSTEDINKESTLKDVITESTIGIGLGEAWSFSEEIINKFNGRLLDLMGIRLPQYRGGAHYSWQILRNNKIGCCNLQVINKDMVQGVFDSGEIVKSREYFFSPTVRIPDDYFEFAVTQEIDFIKEFLEEINLNKDFEFNKVQENFSIYFPRLSTDIHGYINWNWNTEDIERFICAFDDPYAGASTFLHNQRVYLKKAYTEYNDGPFHPFQSGLIYKIYSNSIFVATKNGTLIIREVFNSKKQNVISEMKTGQRLYTPKEYLEKAMISIVAY